MLGIFNSVKKKPTVKKVEVTKEVNKKEEVVKKEVKKDVKKEINPLDEV